MAEIKLEVKDGNHGQAAKFNFGKLNLAQLAILLSKLREYEKALQSEYEKRIKSGGN